MGFGRKGRCFHRSEVERRRSERTTVSLAGSLQTPATSRSVVLKDISSTGAQVSGSDFPKVGEFVRIYVEGASAFATVLWAHGEDCGLRFDGMLSQEELEIFSKAHREAAELDLQNWALNMKNDRAAGS